MNKETIDLVVRNATLAADSVSIGFVGTDAERTRAIVCRAVEFLIGNKIVTLVPQKDWPEWLVMDPPYQLD